MICFNDKMEFIDPFNVESTHDISTAIIEKQIVYDLQSLIPGNQKVLVIFTNPKSWGNIELLVSTDTDIDYVVYNCSDHPFQYPNKHLTDICQKPIIRLDGNFDSPYYYPYWLLASRRYAFKNDNPIVDKLKPHRVEYLCNKTRVSRIYMAVQLSTKNYFNDINIMWGHINDTVYAPGAPIGRLTTDEFIKNIMTDTHGSEYFDFVNFNKGVEKFRQLRIRFESASAGAVFSIVDGLSTAYLQLVSESVLEKPSTFISEKIWKPIRAGQLFLVQGPIGTIELLRYAGFDVFDDYIDHSRYDRELDWQKRTDLMLSVLDDIYPNIENIYFKTIERRQANIDRFKSQKLLGWALSNVTKQIQNLNK